MSWPTTTMSLPPANSDAAIPVLRGTLQSVYASTFNAFPFLRSILTDLNSTVKTSGNSRLQDDIAWALESLNGDSEKLYKIQSHVQFLNAEETYTTKNEIIKVFKEFASFVQMILLDDLLATLKGVDGTLTPQEKELVQLKGNALADIVIAIQKFGVAFNVMAQPLKQIDTNDLDHEIELSHQTIRQLQNQLSLRSEVLARAVENLKVFI